MSYSALDPEYDTFCPPGETCPGCKKPIKSLEPCRRVVTDRQSGGPLVIYRHINCCPEPPRPEQAD
ncbi:hypothetical protein OV450_3441 [Actinobacteria bacterium OV450]|nr:hypothetical protein OV450_3441 [Actinobacteria bacterium OV450]